jgi:hypothetical protein
MCTNRNRYMDSIDLGVEVYLQLGDYNFVLTHKHTLLYPTVASVPLAACRASRWLRPDERDTLLREDAAVVYVHATEARHTSRIEGRETRGRGAGRRGRRRRRLHAGGGLCAPPSRVLRVTARLLLSRLALAPATPVISSGARSPPTRREWGSRRLGTTWGHWGTTWGHWGTTWGHWGTTWGHWGTTWGHWGTTWGHWGHLVGSEERSVGTARRSSSLWRRSVEEAL